MKPYRSFSYIFLVIAGCGSSVVIGFNAAIDPFGVTNSPRIYGINQSKPETINNTRLYKAIDLTRQNAKTIFLGASRLDEALNPDSPALAEYQPVYNLAMQGGTFYEQRRYLEHAIATQKNLEVVIFGIDLWLLALPEATQLGFDENRIGKSHLRLLEFLQTYLSWNTFNKSLETLQKNKEEPDTIYYHANGLRDIGYIDLEFTHWLPFVVNKKKNDIVPETLENIRIIRDLCQEHGLDLRVFITPPHAIQFEGSIAAAGESKIENRKRKIVKIMPVWDFSGYNSVTTEPLSSEMTQYRDSSHFTIAVGDLILNRMLQYNENSVPNDFGVLINSDNIEEHLAQIRGDRETWRKNNPDTIELLNKFKR